MAFLIWALLLTSDLQSPYESTFGNPKYCAAVLAGIKYGKHSLDALYPHLETRFSPHRTTLARRKDKVVNRVTTFGLLKLEERIMDAFSIGAFDWQAFARLRSGARAVYPRVKRAEFAGIVRFVIRERASAFSPERLLFIEDRLAGWLRRDHLGQRYEYLNPNRISPRLAISYDPIYPAPPQAYEDVDGFGSWGPSVRFLEDGPN